MNLSFRLIAKLGLLLVIIGFFMPVACNQNGFEIANALVKNERAVEGILMYVLLISAIVGVLIGISIIMSKGIAGDIDWIVIIICIASGLIVYFRLLKRIPKLQTGAYLVLVGWIVAFSGQLLSKIRKE
ncbi:MAG: hypothetical protein LBV17_09080 [Treponema sp.]|jgi:hypothetical protein|nr:hypothetical protein [Treponema sp.]